MELIVLRHGQTEFNVKELCDSDMTVKTPLTDLGREQILNARKVLGDLPFDAVYTSEFERAQESTRIITSKKYFVDSRLNDRLTGMHGKPTREFHNALQNSNDFWNTKFTNGESFEEEKSRVFSFLDELRRMSYERVLIVTHMETIQIISGYFMQLDNDSMWSLQVPNGSILKFNF